MHRTANLEQLSKRQIDELVHRQSPAVEEADAMYRMWTQREPDQDYIIDFDWPEELVLLGRATGIGYRSDKWEKLPVSRNGTSEELVTHDYIHRHIAPFPYVAMQRPSKNDVKKKRRSNLVEKELQKTIGAELVEQPEFVHEKFEAPEDFVFTVLGLALDLEYERDGEVQQLDWTEGKVPLLAADTERDLLIILPIDGGYPVLMWSPVMNVTARGIEN